MGARLAKSEYESLVVQTLRYYLIERDPGLVCDGKIRVENVRLDTSGPVHMLEIFFRDDARPRCLFGWRFPATESDADALEGVEPDPWEKGHREAHDAGVITGAGIEAWLEWEAEAFRYGVDPDVHSAAGNFARWGRGGGLRTLQLYGPRWFGLLTLRRWGKIPAEDLDAARL
jgi:hypothetical protein